MPWSWPRRAAINAARWIGVARESPRHGASNSNPGRKRPQAGNPAWDVGAEFLIFFPEFAAQHRLFIKKHKSKKPPPDNESVLQQRNASEEQSLAEDQRRDGNIHGVAHVAIQSGNHEAPRGSNGRRRAQPLNRETRKGIQQDGKSSHD